jgi:hypothetical protein
MKLSELVRKDKKSVKQTIRNEKRKNRPVSDEWLNVQGDGLGDNVNRGLNNNEGYI